MASPSEKLAASLALLKQVQDRGQRVFQSSDLSRVHRERLVASGFLRDIVKGWYMISRPNEQEGDSTAWYASFFEFVAAYCNARFGEAWYLSPEASLLRHAGGTAIPRQVLVHAKDGKNNNLQLRFDTSLFDYRARDMAAPENVVLQNGLRLLSLSAALVRATPTLYADRPLDMQIALAQIKDVSDVLVKLLDGGHSVVAGRIAGALRAIGRGEEADRIVQAMRASGYAINEHNPFEKAPLALHVARPESPASIRIRCMWAATRDKVLATFPAAPGLPTNIEQYISDLNDRHVQDAYHSLSIEGYQVSEALIAKIASGVWSPDDREEDKNDRNALAAKGYHLAFERVRDSVSRILEHAEPGQIVRRDHHDWYMQMFEPSVRVGILEARNLAGYRSSPVFIRNARHVPPSADLVRDAMPTFFDLLSSEPEPSVRAVLGHFIFVFIHPYPDGNGRMGRFLMNTMLASGGYPWTVIEVADRKAYMEALEQASVQGNIEPFSTFVGACVARQMEQERPRANIPIG